MRKMTRRALTRRGLSAGILAAGLAPEMLTSRLAYAQTPAKPAVAPKKGGTLTTILTPERPSSYSASTIRGRPRLLRESYSRDCWNILHTEPMPLLAKIVVAVGRQEDLHLQPAGQREVPRRPADDGGRRDLLDHQVPYGTVAARPPDFIKIKEAPRPIRTRWC